MSENITVVKRDGTIEEFNPEKIHKVITWAASGLDGVSVSEVELRAKVQITDGIRTEDIHEAIVKSAADLTTTNNPDYALLAGRLNNFKLRKEAYEEYNPPKLYDFICGMVIYGKYDKDILKYYTKEEMDELDAYIEHDRDYDISYSGSKQLEGKYLVQDRVTKKVFETPNMAFMVISMLGFYDYPEDTKLDYVKKAYDGLSKFKISLPTPIMGGLRTPTKQFSSCVVIEAGDSLDSINGTSNAIVKYISQRAGIGLSISRIRALGSSIRGGEAVHTGLIPFIKKFQADVKSCSQG